MASSKKLHIPKSVLEMKFMKKSKDRVEKELENTKNHENLYANVITSQMRNASGNFISETSFVFCEDLLEGRLSFKGMNPEIERLMELEEMKNKPEDDMHKDVTDDILLKKMEAFNKQKRSYNDSPSKYRMSKKKKVH